MKKRKFAAAALLGLCMTLAGAIPAFADGMKVVTLGADLSDAQKTTMMKYFNAKPDEVQILYITNADEHRHLDGIVPSWVIGSRTVSCAYVKPTTSGGIKVRTANLNWVTGNMIASTLSTSGVKNCEVIAACPFEVSGTGALTGIQMAYEVASGQKLDETKKQIATEEIVVTGNLADQVGTTQATTVVNQSKMEVIQNNVTNTSEIHNIVNNVVNENNVEVNAEQIDLIVALMEEIAKQNYNYEDVKETLEHVNENTTGKPAEVTPTPTAAPGTAGDINISINIESQDVQNQNANQQADSNANSSSDQTANSSSDQTANSSSDQTASANQQTDANASSDQTASQTTSTEQSVENQTSTETVVVPTEYQEEGTEPAAAEAEDSILDKVDESILGEDIITSSTEEPEYPQETEEVTSEGTQETGESETDASEDAYDWDDFVWEEPGTEPEPGSIFLPPASEWEENTETEQPTETWTEFPSEGTEQPAETWTEFPSEGTEQPAETWTEFPSEGTEQPAETWTESPSEGTETSQEGEEGTQTAEGNSEENPEGESVPETGAAASDEMSQEEIDTRVAQLSEQAKSQYEKAKAFCEGEFEGNTESMYKVAQETWVPAVIIYDPEVAAKVSKKIYTEYLKVLSDGTADFMRDGTEKYFSDELNVMNKFLEKLFGTATETPVETEKDILSTLSQDEKNSLYKETIRFFEKMYGEETFEDTSATETQTGEEGTDTQSAEYTEGEYNAEADSYEYNAENTEGDTWYSEDGTENWESDGTEWETEEYVYEG